MKAVVFVCFLTFSMCLSDQTTVTGTPTIPETHPLLNSTTLKPEPKKENQGKPSAPNTTEAVTTSLTTETPHVTEKANPPAAPNNEKASGDNTVDNKTGNKPENSTKSNEAKTDSPKSDDNSKNQTSTEATTGDKDKKASSTTEKAVTPKTTDAPMHTTDKPVVTTRAFDGPSFIGGIILTLGLLAIGFMGLKYYRNQTERNYHTL